MFWDLRSNNGKAALIDSSSLKSLDYGAAEEYICQLSEKIRSDQKKLAFLFCENNFSTIFSYVSCLRTRQAVFLLDAKMARDLKDGLIALYSPEIIFDPEGNYYQGYEQFTFENCLQYHIKKTTGNIPEIHQDLAVLLSTSGTTGSPKLVRLSYKNLQSNAESISEYLGINENEKAITSLPMSYSYGLSVINSHLLNGASIVLSKSSITMMDFWNEIRDLGCTSFAGVPYSYQLMKRINFHKMNLPGLRTLTQAGGRLSEEFIEYFHDIAKEKGMSFYVMYGQTEATARISYVPCDMLEKKIGSIGIPIPGGKMALYSKGQEITDPGQEGELVYFGQNVMMGYATSRQCLSLGNELNFELHTGDLARKDSDGYFYITGRMKRFIKIFGWRLNLDELEKMLENHLGCPVACSGTDDILNLLIGSEDAKLLAGARTKLIETYKLHRSVLKLRGIKCIPLTYSGKKDYTKINEIMGDL